MKMLSSCNDFLGREVGKFISLSGAFAFSLMALACKQGKNVVGNESGVATAAGSRNGGFRILPQLAARDALRSKVIYRCNDVACGEAFQPSNEEQDVVIACGLEPNLYPGGRLPPFLRMTGKVGWQKLIVRKDHQEACEHAQPFEKVLAQMDLEKPSLILASAEMDCRAFRANREVCQANEGQGCRWVTHPSGRGNSPLGGDCVGLFRSGTRPNGTENVQSLPLGSQPVSWAPVESYRPAATGRVSEPK